MRCSPNLERAIVLAMAQRVTSRNDPDMQDGETPFEGRLRSLLRDVAEVNEGTDAGRTAAPVRASPTALRF